MLIAFLLIRKSVNIRHTKSDGNEYSHIEV